MIISYKIFHRLFGWDYIQWRNFADQGIARVYIDQNSRVFFWRYKGTQIADFVNHKDEVIWLTCHPSKYLKEQP